MLKPWLYGLIPLGIFVFFAWLRTRTNYRISPSHLEITFLGVVVRKIALSNIEMVTKRHVRWSENWWNTWRPFRRRLLIRRRKGLLKNVVITPKYRYEFKAELERGMQRAHAPADPVVTPPGGVRG